MTWQEIHGWFDYELAYCAIIDALPNNGRFVEVGCWLGKSIIAFSELARHSGKQIEIHAVDTFRGVPDCARVPPEIKARINEKGIAELFRANLHACGANNITVHVHESVAASKEFTDSSLDACFIDADHSYVAVKADIEAWLRKVKSGGILAGHDIDEEGVTKAVNELLPDVETVGRCWLYRVP
jgi:SAM-dependent methyltransferase